MRVDGWFIVLIFIGLEPMFMLGCCAWAKTGRHVRVKRIAAIVRGMTDSSPDDYVVGVQRELRCVTVQEMESDAKSEEREQRRRPDSLIARRQDGERMEGGYWQYNG